MIQTITTPTTHIFNSFEVLRDSALPLGTRANITFTNGDEVTFELAHKNAYGATNIFVIADCYGEHCMNHKPTNKGGYNESDMRQHVREDIVPLLPEELRKLIIPRTIRQKLGDSIVEPKNGSDLIWLPSITEMSTLTMYTLTSTTPKRAVSRSWIHTAHGCGGSGLLRHRIQLISSTSPAVASSRIRAAPSSRSEFASASAFNQQSKNPARLSAGRRNNIIKENHNGQKTEHRAIPLYHGKRKKTGH